MGEFCPTYPLVKSPPWSAVVSWEQAAFVDKTCSQFSFSSFKFKIDGIIVENVVLLEVIHKPRDQLRGRGLAK